MSQFDGQNRLLSIHEVFSFLHPGERPIQEDYLLTDVKKQVFAIADGFGGPGVGTKAAEKSCAAIQEFLFREIRDEEATLPFVLRSYLTLAANVLFNALIHANRTLMAHNQGKSANEKGGASLLAAFMDGSLLALANLGACSAWLFRGERLTPLMHPRTLQALNAPGGEPHNPNWAVPLVSLGIFEDIEPEIMEYRIRAGDWVLLQSDGLQKELRESIFNTFLNKPGEEIPLKTLFKSFLDPANIKPADNMAFQVIRFSNNISHIDTI